MKVSDPYKSRLSFGAAKQEVEVGECIDITPDAPFRFDSGAEMPTITLAYQTYGTLNADKSNAILVPHGLTGDQYIASPHPVTGKEGWWQCMVGDGKVLDTERYFIITCNVLGGCMGSSGPKSINPETGEPYGLDFPMVTIADMVRAQTLLIEALGIETLFAVVGGSMGGMLTLEWGSNHPDKLRACVPIATASRYSPQNIAFHEIGRQAVMADPEWCDGHYIKQGTFPAKGLAVARMTAHVTYLSEAALQEKFGRRLQDKANLGYGFGVDFQVESYLRHQGKSFVERFDPNSYLYITRAMDYFDLEDAQTSQLSTPFQGTSVKFCLMSFSSDWLFTTAEAKRVVRALNAVAADVSFTEIITDRGHDAFLLDEPEFHQTLQGFLDGCAAQWGLA